MKQLFMVLACVVLFFEKGIAQNSLPIAKNLDSLAIHTPQYAAANIDSLVQYCQSVAPTETEQVRFYFVWTATHIHYDTAQLFVKKRHSCKQNYDSVFVAHKAICRGFTDLFNQLCIKSGIEAQSITGHSKDVEGKTDTAFLHAWSAAKVNNQWRLFDVTWASNHFESDNLIDSDFNEYFNQPSFPFIKRHLPFDPIWQLRNDVLSAATFFANIDFKNEEDMPTTAIFSDINKIIEENLALEPVDQSIKSIERAINFNPSETRLYGILNYHKSEKALVSFEKAKVLLEKFKNMEDESLKHWTYQDVVNLISDAKEVSNLLANTLTIYESMTYVCENEDTQAIKSNMVSIKKNKDLILKLIEYLDSIREELKKIPLAKANR